MTQGTRVLMVAFRTPRYGRGQIPVIESVARSSGPTTGPEADQSVAFTYGDCDVWAAAIDFRELEVPTHNRLCQPGVRRRKQTLGNADVSSGGASINR